MKLSPRIIATLFSLFLLHSLYAQDSIPVSYHPRLFSGKEQVDIIDLIRAVVMRHAGPRKDSSNVKTGKLHASVLPAVQYTLQTGFAALLTGNVAFYTDNHPDAKISSVLMSINYTQNKQFFVPIQANIWTRGNKYNIITDWHFDKFPQTTYGLGGHTLASDGYTIDYTYIRLYQTLLKTIAPNFFIGPGYDLDYYWKIKEVDPPAGAVTDFQRYGLSQKAVSSGITFNALYDNTSNSINPQGGYHAGVIFRPNFTFLGSDDNWQSLSVDLRKYNHFPANSRNILAFWSYNYFTLGGNPPYLSLPSTASDTYVNSGRGYIQGRFRGKNMVYLESEYRFGITANGLLGGVVFLNAQSFSEIKSKQFEVVSPGYGLGLRFKLNKFSKTNICIDYGFGAHGSQGIFANLGEVF
ncbi:MAG: hypothetical protein NVSMB63_15840 [Sediminibacterium sp.]